MTRWLLLLGIGAVSCSKVPLLDVNAGFSRADMAWFEEENTLFVFYEVSAEQGITEHSVVEVTYATDDGVVDWTPVSAFSTVHPHVPVDCGVNALCGSTSIAVDKPPREVGMRLRYHPDGELALDARAVFNRVGRGAPHSSRSLVVYGVFDEFNRQVQWRSRNQFPTVRNEEATELGLRRNLTISDMASGFLAAVASDNPYAYGVPCSGSFQDLGLGVVSTNARAVFHPDDVPPLASAASAICADATVEDATGTFTTTAYARKNPEVRPAFPLLRSPVDQATQISFFLQPCLRTINRDHEEMQRQRLQMEDVRATCIDDWTDPSFENRLVALFSDAIEAERVRGDDMVLAIAIHHDDSRVTDLVEGALARILPDERHRSTPRVAGGFVFDSEARELDDPDLSAYILWCPSILDPSSVTVSSAALATCAIAPDIPGLDLGPLSFGMLPVLAPREDYLKFIRDYSKRQAGSVLDLEWLAPRFATTTDHVDLGAFGVVTFLNDERISAEFDDAYSYCAPKNPLPVAFRSDFMASDAFSELIAEVCRQGDIQDDYCATLEAGVLPLEMLPEWHVLMHESGYELGVYWDFPYLLRMEYEAVVAGSISAVGLTVPFGFARDGETYYGSEVWRSDSFALDEVLTQCDRFCDFPTFDSAGVYQVHTPFSPVYQSNCYVPTFPTPADGGFPLDP